MEVKLSKPWLILKRYFGVLLELQHLTSIFILWKMAVLWGYKAFWSEQSCTGIHGLMSWLSSQLLWFPKILRGNFTLRQRSWMKIVRLMLLPWIEINLFQSYFLIIQVLKTETLHIFLKIQILYIFLLLCRLAFTKLAHLAYAHMVNSTKVL